MILNNIYNQKRDTTTIKQTTMSSPEEILQKIHDAEERVRRMREQVLQAKFVVVEGLEEQVASGQINENEYLEQMNALAGNGPYQPPQ